MLSKRYIVVVGIRRREAGTGIRINGGRRIVVLIFIGKILVISLPGIKSQCAVAPWNVW